MRRLLLPTLAALATAMILVPSAMLIHDATASATGFCANSNDYLKVNQTSFDHFTTAGSATGALGRVESPSEVVSPLTDPFNNGVWRNAVNVFVIPGSKLTKVRLTTEYFTDDEDLSTANGGAGRSYFITNVYGESSTDSTFGSLELCVGSV